MQVYKYFQVQSANILPVRRDFSMGDSMVELKVIKFYIKIVHF